MATDSNTLPSRRAVLAGALGGLAAAAAASLGRAQPAAAVTGDPLILGDGNNSTASTSILGNGTNTSVFAAYASGSGFGLLGTTESGNGVRGATDSGYGVYGSSNFSYGVAGTSQDSYGIYGSSRSATASGILGQSLGKGTAVQGYSGIHAAPTAPARTGVFGSANQGTTAVGVRGSSSTGRGAVLSGKLAQLNLKPSSAASHPQSGQAGDLFVDASDRLWFCKGGTTWVKLA